MAKKTTDNLLSADFLNSVVLKVLHDVDEILDRIILEGLLSTGYAPMEMPTNKDVVRRLTPEQIPQIMETLDPPEQQALMKMVQEVYEEGSE